MVKGPDRKAAVAAFRERKARVGIYSISCAATGERWVGRSPDLEAIRKRILFTLSHGSNPHRTLQEAWNRYGTDEFAFEELEVLLEDLSPVAEELWLKKKVQNWVSKLQARRV